MNEPLRKRITQAIEAEGVDLVDDQIRCLVDGVMSEIQPELDKLREANRERGRISTRLYLARLELKDTQSRLRRAHLRKHAGSEGWSFYIRLLRDLMHAIDPGLRDGPLREDLDHCLRLAQKHRHDSIAHSDHT